MRKNYVSMYACALLILVVSCSKSDKSDPAPPPSEVKAPPASLALDVFYKKYTDAEGIPVVSSDKVPDQALLNAKAIIKHMLVNISAAKAKMIENKLRVGIMAISEKPTQLPEYRDLYTAFPGTDWDKRARAYGATLQRPLTSTCEENALCKTGDWYKGEEILTHEFAHAIHELGLKFSNPNFDTQLTAAFNSAKTNGLWTNTYAISDVREYWAEGVQCWFNCNLEANPANGVHNSINTRAELKTYDVPLYNLIKQFFPDDAVKHGCY